MTGYPANGPYSSPAWSVAVVTPPEAPDDLPVTVAAARKQCQIGHTDDDDLLERLVKAADDQAFAWAKTYLCPRTVRVDFAHWPRDAHGADACLRLPYGPVRVIDSVKYYDPDGTLTTFSADDWQSWLAFNPPLVLPAPNKVWPSLQAGKLPAVQVQCQVGYATVDEIPASLQQAVLVLVAFNREHPEGFERTGRVVVPPAFASLVLAGGVFGYA